MCSLIRPFVSRILWHSLLVGRSFFQWKLWFFLCCHLMSFNLLTQGLGGCLRHFWVSSYSFTIFGWLVTIDPKYTKIPYKLVVHVIIIDQWIQVTVIDSIVILVAVTSECCVKGLSVKPGLSLVLEHWKTVQTQTRRHRTWSLIRVCTVCLNYRKLRVKWNRSGPFSRQSTRSVLSVLWLFLHSDPAQTG